MTVNVAPLSIGSKSVTAPPAWAPSASDTLQVAYAPMEPQYIGTTTEKVDQRVKTAGYQVSGTVAEFVLRVDHPWLRKADLAQAKNVIQFFNQVASRVGASFSALRLEWPLEYALLNSTESERVPVFIRVSEDAAQFIAERGLADSVAWLQTTAPTIFDRAHFEIDLLRGEDDEEGLLALRVLGTLDPSEFRSRRHRLCEAMRTAGHRPLYEVTSIFQRRLRVSGWQTLSWYSAFSA